MTSAAFVMKFSIVKVVIWYVLRQQKALKTKNDYAKRRALSWSAVLKQRFHKRRRENHINEKTIPSLPTTDANKATTRLSSPAVGGKSYVQKFDYRTFCLFCREKICKRGPESVEILSHKKEDIDSISFVKSSVD